MLKPPPNDHCNSKLSLAESTLSDEENTMKEADVRLEEGPPRRRWDNSIRAEWADLPRTVLHSSESLEPAKAQNRWSGTDNGHIKLNKAELQEHEDRGRSTMRFWLVTGDKSSSRNTGPRRPSELLSPRAGTKSHQTRSILYLHTFHLLINNVQVTQHSGQTLQTCRQAVESYVRKLENNCIKGQYNSNQITTKFQGIQNKALTKYQSSIQCGFLSQAKGR